MTSNEGLISPVTAANAVLPAPITRVTEAFETANPQVPGEIRLDPHGLLLRDYLTYEGFAAPLIEAYDNWITNILPRQVASRNITLADGGRVVFDRIFTEKPKVTPQMVRMTPEMARDSMLTYAADVSADISYVAPDGTRTPIDRILIGKIPVMVLSSLCHLHGKTDMEILAMRECPKDPGAYFIIKGTEKVVLIQEKLALDKIFVFVGDTKVSSKGGKSAKSVPKGRLVARMTTNTMQGSTVILLKEGKRRNIKLSLHFMGKNKDGNQNSIGVLQTYRMLGAILDDLLGITDPNQKFSNTPRMMQMLSQFTRADWVKKVWITLQPSFLKLSLVGDDIEYILRKRGPTEGATAADRRARILTLLQDELFPQITTAPRPGEQPNETRRRLILRKLEMLSIMVVRMAEVMAGLRPVDDRDDWGNKRLETAARSMEQLFHGLWAEYIRKTEDTIRNKNYTRETVRSAFIHHAIITDGFTTSFNSNNWGVKGYYKENITDVLKRDNLLSTYSHLRRVNTPTSRKAKQPMIRLVQMSQLGYIDPIETPEGENCLESGETVLRPDGSYKAMGDMENCDEVITIDPITLQESTTKIYRHFVIPSDKYGKKVVTVLTADDRSITVTADHRFLTLRGWVQAKDLDLDTDRVCVRRGPNDCIFIQVRSIEEQPPCLVGDFTTVSDNHSFVSGQGFVTHNCGIVKNMTVTCYISLQRDENLVWRRILDESASRPQTYISDIQTTYHNSKFMLNGKFMGWCPGQELREFCVTMRRTLVFPKDTSVVLDPDNFLYVYTNGARPTRPLLIVDTDGELVIAKKNLWRATTTELLSQGCIEYIDAFEQHYIYVAQSIWDMEAKRNEVFSAQQLLQRAEETLVRIIEKIQAPGAQPNLKDEETRVEAEREVHQARDTMETLLRRRPYTHCELDPSAILGIAASVIPMPEHNQGPRNTFSCGQGRQALGIYHSNYMTRFDTTSKMLAFPTRPLFEPQINELLGLNELPTGETVIVAIMTYLGYNQEDAFIFNKASIDRGLFRMLKMQTYRSALKQTKQFVEEFTRPEIVGGEPTGRYDNIDEYGYPRVGAIVKQGDCIIGKVRIYHGTGRTENASVFIGVGEEGIVDDVLITENEEKKPAIKVRIRQMRFPIIGDKFAPRSAQKGTIGTILPEEDMPFISSGSNAGLKPDIIINPHCLRGDTLVTMPSGLARRIDSMNQEGGGIVWGWNGKGMVPAHQVAMEPKGKREIVRLTLEDGRTIHCTPDHRFLVRTATSYEWVEAKDLQPLGEMTNGTWSRRAEGSRIVMGLEGVVDEPTPEERASEMQWNVDLFHMRTPLDREKSMAFARIVGAICTDGCVSVPEWTGDESTGESIRTPKEKFILSETINLGQPNVTANLGHELDASAMVADIALITGKVPQPYFSKGVWAIHLPATLARIIASLPGMTIGRRSQQPAELPRFVLEPGCPVSIIREFLGGLFGGDGHAPRLVGQDHRYGGAAYLANMAFGQTICLPYAESLHQKMEQICQLMEKAGVPGAYVQGPFNSVRGDKGIRPKDYETNPRVEYRIAVPIDTNFAKRIGFRYCIQKASRLSAANAYWRFQENVKRQHDRVVTRANELFDGRKSEKFTLAMALEQSRQELLSEEPSIWDYYSLSSFKDLRSRRNSRNNYLKRFEYGSFPDAAKFLTEAGCVSWFQDQYVTQRGADGVETFTLKLLDRRSAGEDMVYDISVSHVESLVANGLFSHNCIPSRMTMGMIIEIVASKLAALQGERVNATAFRPFDIDELRRNLKQYGYNEFGNEVMHNGMTGKRFKAQIFIGPCYYQALRHHVQDKIQMRSRGAINPVSHQPVGGRARHGGLRSIRPQWRVKSLLVCTQQAIQSNSGDAVKPSVPNSCYESRLWPRGKLGGMGTIWRMLLLNRQS
jgi:DNA-directed RNA polymerase beta subunit